MQVKSLRQKAKQQIGIIYRKFTVILTVLHYWYMYDLLWSMQHQFGILIRRGTSTHSNPYKILHPRFAKGTGLWIIAVSWAPAICPHWPV